jgi:alpha-ketoglutarate-dependent taurine dioxygenase
VVSNRALPLHCDHHRADLIAWYCHADAEAGGETLLLDFEELYGTLPSKMKAALEHLAFREHKVFAEDCEQHPFHTVSKGRSRFYYSFWPVDHTLTGEVEAAYLALKELIAAQHPVAIRLQPGEALFIDNTRVLHGRTAFVGTARHLERNWIRLNQFYNH